VAPCPAQIQSFQEATPGSVAANPIQVDIVSDSFCAPNGPGILLAPIELLEIAPHDHDSIPADAPISFRSERRSINASAQVPRILRFQRNRCKASTRK
jgi:hypothetical protein